LLQHPRITRAWAAAFVACACLSSHPVFAQGYTLPTSSATGFLQTLQSKMQELASFVSSPLGAFVVLLAFIGAACSWVFAPKSGAVMVGMRAVFAGLAVFNVTAIISYLTLGSGTGN
jgi:hypothetical protein